MGATSHLEADPWRRSPGDNNGCLRHFRIVGRKGAQALHCGAKPGRESPLREIRRGDRPRPQAPQETPKSLTWGLYLVL